MSVPQPINVDVRQVLFVQHERRPLRMLFSTMRSQETSSKLHIVDN